MPASGEPNKVMTDAVGDRRVGLGTSIAHYWPYAIFQDNGPEGSGLLETNITINKIRDSQYFTRRILNGDDGPKVAWRSPLVALPISATVPGQELRVVYRSTEGAGKLAVWDRGADGAQLQRRALPPGFEVSEGSPLAGFATRKGTNSLATRLIWRAQDGKIVSGWQEGGNMGDWKGPAADPVFEGADRDTQLACVTAATTSQEGISVVLQEDDKMNRCYFMKGGKLKEVWFDGEKWVDAGFVYMP